MKKSVLVVEDQIELRQVVCLFLNQLFDVEIAEANDGQEALSLLQSTQFDLILTDLNMPNVNGLEMTEQIRRLANYQSTPIIMLTSEGEALREQALTRGVTEFFNKPMQPEHLMPAVQRYLSE